MLGKPVPDFSLLSTGGTFRLSSTRGSKVVLYFYPNLNFPFELLADPQETVCEQFGVMNRAREESPRHPNMDARGQGSRPRPGGIELC
jgi:peroxiredoxin